MTVEGAQDIVLLLQSDPLYYRHFGVWWWWVKSELKRNGFTQRNLAHLGDFTDPVCAETYYHGVTPTELDAEALDFQAAAAATQLHSPTSWAPDGELYYLHDQDAE